MKAILPLLLVALASCSAGEPAGDVSYEAHRIYQRCVEANSKHLGRPDETSAAEAVSATSSCERQLRIAAYLQAKKRAGKGDYRHVSEVNVYREWKDGLRNMALCRLSNAIDPKRCFTTD